ncbi:hypothetical protein JRQ81_013219 [Phrynocephalus forsythii]|uniref:Complexin-1 n=1 Tax=Phrynocephalus forsythii TaxID=171643 RepID=A0A9Q0Y1Y6_9SAUR|nr:hypothetical protein JRQ81_013219 [Phrynocephalus forsythii]
MLGGEEEKDPDAAKKEEERQEALRQQEEERKAKYAKMEAEREVVRQGIRDKRYESLGQILLCSLQASKGLLSVTMNGKQNNIASLIEYSEERIES